MKKRKSIPECTIYIVEGVDFMNRVNDELLRLIIQEIMINSQITERQIAKKYFYSERSIRRYMKILKDNEMIKLVRCGKKRYWKII